MRMNFNTRISTSKRMAVVAIVSLFAIAMSTAIVEARGHGGGGGGGGHGGGGGGHGGHGGHIGGGGGGARAFSGGGARAFSSGGNFRGFAGSRAFSGNGLTRGYSRSFAGYHPSIRYFTRGLGLNSSARLAGLSTRSLGPGLVTGSVRGAGRASLLRNSAFASAGTGRHWALTRGSFHGHFANQNWNSHGGWWWNHHHAIVAIGWYGGLFWPYAYWDFLDYTFWPYAYDGFWPYAYDDFYVGLLGPYAYEGPDYAPRIRYSRRGRVIREPSTTGSVIVCNTQVPALANWPIEQIAKTVEPNEAQQAALAEFKDSIGKSMDALKAACPDDLPSTPTGRMAAMHKRIAAMLLAINVVQPPLQRFYDSLTDEQKARFNVVSPEEQTGSTRSTRRGDRLVDLSRTCGDEQIKAANVPVDRIVQSVRPTDAQRAALDSLNGATAKAADLLKATCSKEQVLTPPGRVAAMEQRLRAMLEAVNVVEPELEAFYRMLTDEQKARFNQLGAGEG